MTERTWRQVDPDNLGEPHSKAEAEVDALFNELGPVGLVFCVCGHPEDAHWWQDEPPNRHCQAAAYDVVGNSVWECSCPMLVIGTQKRGSAT